MFYQSYFGLLIFHNILHHCFAWKFYNFTFLPIFEVGIISITNNDYDKYFSIEAWGKPGGSCDAKVKEKHQKK